MTETEWLKEVNRLKAVFLDNEKCQQSKLKILDAAREEYYVAERTLLKTQKEYRDFLQKHP